MLARLPGRGIVTRFPSVSSAGLPDWAGRAARVAASARQPNKCVGIALGVLFGIDSPSPFPGAVPQFRICFLPSPRRKHEPSAGRRICPGACAHLWGLDIRNERRDKEMQGYGVSTVGLPVCLQCCHQYRPTFLCFANVLMGPARTPNECQTSKSCKGKLGRSDMAAHCITLGYL